MDLFDKKYVYYLYCNVLENKKVFFAHDIQELIAKVNKGDVKALDTFKGDFGTFNFVYYDPNYSYKVAYLNGKVVQRLNKSDGKTESWKNLKKFYFEDTATYRLEPSDFDGHLYMQKLCDKVVQYYYSIHYNEIAFDFALELIISTSFVTVEKENGRLFLYALDPMDFTQPSVSKDYPNLWNYVQDWTRNEYGLELAIGMYKPGIYKDDAHYIYKDTKAYMLELRNIVKNKVLTFEEAFLES